MSWTVELLDARVEKELAALPLDMRAKFQRIAELLELEGLEAAREPHVKSLGRGLFEMRMSGRDGIARAIYVTRRVERIVVVLVFVKKTTKTPKSVIETALQRAKAVK